MARPSPSRAGGTDAGAAVVDFVFVSVLVVTLFAVVFQVGLALHTRNVLVALAAEGARYGADADVDSPQEVRQRTLDGITTAFNATYAARATVTPVLGRDVVAVRISAPMPLAFLPGSPVTLVVEGHALEESR
ncbi:MAG: pilus assembly protein TadE [Frankiales bacterium]|nr:pilus assembly protein TadE [Frankiales bacterium]